MTTITNNKLTDERVSNATLIRLIQWAEQHNSHYVAAALCELQERRKADSAEPAGYHVIKEQPVPVVPPAIKPDYEVIKSILPTANPDEYACCIAADMWNACRAAMLNGGKS
ncbi:hypothetical protein ACE1OY_000901 [Salmonella enterica]|nr:hypothetical protein [Salmonella enterica subsp. enterica]ELQ8550052.1 hypothetical protein [Salmonella enterica]PWD20593.1 hypothetical protein C4652_13105 [Salmonella enterica subsp. enterica serovar Weslaco]